MLPQATPIPSTVPTLQPYARTCWRCGRKAVDVRSKIALIGLRSVVQLICDDDAACWARWNAQHPTA